MIATIVATVTLARPNIIVFIVDDLGLNDSSVAFTTPASPFNSVYKTPHLEKLAAESTKFTNAYSACAVCTPSRAALMTGKNPARTHITYWTLNGDTSANDPSTKAPRWQWEGLLPDDAPFLPQILHDNGYTTVHCGKAHFGQIGKFAADPKAIGFDINIAGHAAGAPGSYYGTDKFMDSIRKGQPEKPSEWDVPGLEQYWGKDVFLTEALAQEASNTIASFAQNNQPFFLYFAPYAVHTPILPNKRLLSHYPEDMDQRERAYATLIESYDNALGQLRTTLENTAQWQNTVIIFTSDNGGLSVHARAGNDNRNAPLRAGKGSFYEGGARVPLLIHRPNNSAEIKTRPVVGTDLFARVLHEAKIAPNTSSDSSLSRSLGFTDSRPLVWHMPHFWGVNGQGIEPYSAIRSGDNKLIYRHRDQGFELYDLASDISESTNLAAQNPKLVKHLAQTLTAELKEMKAQMPTLKSSGVAVPYPDGSDY